MSRPRAALASAIAAIAVTAGCHLQPPDPPDFGYARSPEGGVLIAYPICPGDTVTGAEIYSDDDDYTTLWRARGPRSAQMEQGVFEVGNDVGFTEEEHPLRGGLPEGFYLSVFEKTADGRTAGESSDAEEEDSGMDAWIDLSRLKGVRLGPGEFMTDSGKVMTRADINAQLGCRTPAPAAPTPAATG